MPRIESRLMNTDTFYNNVLIERVADYGDGTGVRYEYDSDGNETSRTELTGLPIPQTPRETLIGYLDAMTDEQAAPVLAVLGWIATLDTEQAATLTAALATLTPNQGGSQ